MEIANRSLSLRELPFFTFCSRDLDLDPMTIYEHDLYQLEIHRMCKCELPTSRLWKVIIWDRQTDRQADRCPRNYIPCHSQSHTERRIYTVSQKTVTLYIRSYLLQMLANSLNSYTVVFSKKFATKLMPRCPSHLRCVDALPCET